MCGGVGCENGKRAHHGILPPTAMPLNRLLTRRCPVLNKVYTSHPEFPESQMEQGVKRTQRDYSLSFKLAVVDQIEKGELTYKQAQVRYGIQGRPTVLVWLRKHGRQDWSQGASIRDERSCAMSDPKRSLQSSGSKSLSNSLS